jgi:3',5'-cyclic AMP phosphodiesterase CpdA
VTTTVFHCSDLHFGHPAVPEQYEAMEALIQDRRYDVVAISGDLSQRARSGEFQRARAFIKHAERVSKVICIPGNHDVKWWKAPLGFGDERAMFSVYRRYIDDDIEPVLHVAGATFAGLERLRELFSRSPAGDVRVVVMHHNPVKGEISQRHGLKDTKRVLGAFAEMEVDLVLCGHDHQDAIHYIEHTKRGTVISTAGTVSNRMRGGRPSSVNSISITSEKIEVSTLVWNAASGGFVSGPVKCFAR